MRFAIYSRKSKFTGKGESIGNQIEECKACIISKYPDTNENDIFIYEDEGYSGKNTNRPQFQQMMAEEERSPFDFIVVYRLDRISRNITDFTLLMDKLTKKGTSFYSANEGFDTSTISGQMMMTISAAFAQFERQIIAERVRDNVYRLAKTGRWLGGTPPLGFFSEKAEQSGKKYYRLCPNPSELELVRLIYSKYLETRSISKLESFMLNSGYRTRKNSVFYVTTLRYILTNPIYCTADEESCRFFRSKGCEIADIRENCNGKQGFIGYKKTASHGDDRRIHSDISDWTIALGGHEGIISSADWIAVQNIIEGNAEKKLGFRHTHNSDALLSGVLHCKCGSCMRPKYHRTNKNGEKPFSYMCQLKETSKGTLCNCSNINGKAADKMVCDTLLDYGNEDGIFTQYANQLDDTGNRTADTDNLIITQNRLIAKNRKVISKLLIMASGNEGITADYINDEISQLHGEIERARSEINRLEQLKRNGEILSDAVKNTEDILPSFKERFAYMSTDAKRVFIRRCVNKIEWDGENLSIFLSVLQ